MYVTINDIVLNEGTEYEKRRPFEIFINSKNLDHYQWIVASGEIRPVPPNRYLSSITSPATSMEAPEKSGIERVTAG